MKLENKIKWAFVTIVIMLIVIIYQLNIIQTDIGYIKSDVGEMFYKLLK